MSRGYCEQVREFTSLQGLDLPTKPTMMDIKAVDFIADMVESEMDELKAAQSVVDQADALVDAMYYICDCAVKMGLDTDPVFALVHDANMRKVTDGKLTKDERGKVQKPEGWYGPEEEIKKEIQRQIDGTAQTQGKKA